MSHFQTVDKGLLRKSEGKRFEYIVLPCFDYSSVTLNVSNEVTVRVLFIIELRFALHCASPD